MAASPAAIGAVLDGDASVHGDGSNTAHADSGARWTIATSACDISPMRLDSSVVCASRHALRAAITRSG